jgi:HK97 family phage major capsid protein
MNPYLRNKIEERASQSAVLKTLQTRAADEKRDLTESERKTFDEIVERLKELDAEVERIKNFDEGAAKFAELIGAQKEAEEEADRAHEAAKEGTKEREPAEARGRVDFGKRFVESTAFRNYHGAGSSERVPLPGPASREFRAAIMTSDFDPPPTMTWAGPSGYVTRTPLLDTLGRVQTNASAVLYLTWGTTDPQAAVVAEGELKPEAPITPTENSVPLSTYAHYKAITRQALEDVPQIQSIVQNKLLGGVRDALETAAATVIQGGSFQTATGDDLLSGIRVGIATVEEDGYSPNAILVNPADAADLDLAAMGASFSGPVRNGNAWGLPIVAAGAIPAGTAYVGDFSQGVTWFDRGVTDVFMSDSHADFFLRNQLVILAEARAAFAVTEGAAIAEVTVDGGLTTTASKTSTSKSSS